MRNKNKNQLNWYGKRRQEMIDYLGGKCVRCYTIENLEFDHIDRKTKDFNISSMYSYSWEMLVKELDKCQILCKDCHFHKTTEEDGFKTSHGKVAMYKHNKCRCDLCVSANAEAIRAYRAKRKLEDPNYRRKVQIPSKGSSS